MPAGAGTHQESGTPAPGDTLTPQQAADKALRAITPTTAVSTDPTATVAGRPAYQLLLEPRDTASLVGSVRIAIDGATHIPTRVQVFAKGASSPAFEVGFTSFDPSTPSASVFGFNPPPGAKVTEHCRPTGPADGGSGPAAPRDAGRQGARGRHRLDLGPRRLRPEPTPRARRRGTARSAPSTRP